MRTTQGHYATYQKTVYEDRVVIREFHRWRALSARANGRLLLILDEYVRRKVTICTYDSAEERERDIQVLRDIDEDGIQAIARGPKGPDGGGGTAPPAVSAWLPLPRPKIPGVPRK